MRKSKAIRQIVYLAGAVVLIGCIFRQHSGKPGANGVSAHGTLHVEGTLLSDKDGETVTLHGTSTHGIMWYPRYLNGNAMKTLAQYGANVQRLAMYTEAYRGYLEYPEESLNYLYMGIESAMSADMYVIVDWHILEDGNPLEHAEEAIQFFDDMTSHYGNNPAILYEICNEPNGDTTWEDIVEYAHRVIPVIRKNAPDAVILVGTPDYCTDFSGPLESPLPYDNVMYVLHNYIDMFKEEPSDVHLISKLVENELPVFVTEWGMDHTEEEYFGENADWTKEKVYPDNAQPFLDYMEEHQISWTVWALSNKNEVHSLIKRDCEKYSGWKDEDLTEFGKWVFGNFR